MQEKIKPYLLQAFYNWCTDYELTPLIMVERNLKNKIPEHLNSEGQIALNIHPNSITNLIFSPAGLSFDALFNTKPIHISIIYDSIIRIFTKESGYGLEFSSIDIQNGTNDINSKKRGHLTIIK